MSGWVVRAKGFCSRNLVMVVSIPSIVALHWAWSKLQDDEKFVAKHERREFPPLTLFKIAKHWVGLGPMPEKHQPPAD